LARLGTTDLKVFKQILERQYELWALHYGSWMSGYASVFFLLQYLRANVVVMEPELRNVEIA